MLLWYRVSNTQPTLISFHSDIVLYLFCPALCRCAKGTMCILLPSNFRMLDELPFYQCFNYRSTTSRRDVIITCKCSNSFRLHLT
ncbi:hypothetical protein FKM82_021011 [Ascaphus truei]